MCVLVVPDELKQLQKLQQARAEQEVKKEAQKQYSQAFDSYWQIMNKDKLSLVAREKTTDQAFLQMVRHQHMP
ncbi:MAG: hypothetical protein HWE16_10295 [Gammaproteobacteria bacterium]|nr:hypothetical protein [Gammaproteobacteria bacterium]